jgi:hypothetical protein
MQMIVSRPRVRRASSSSTDPLTLQQKWSKKADHDFHQVYHVYLKISKECVSCYHVLRTSSNKKERKQAKKQFLALYPTMTALHKIGFDDFIPYKTIQKLDTLHYSFCRHS